MGWAEDKQKLGELGTGLMIFCALLLALTVLNAFMMAKIWHIGDLMLDNMGDRVSTKVLEYKFFSLLKTLLLAFSLPVLLVGRSKYCVLFVLFALFCADSLLLIDLVRLAQIGKLNSVGIFGFCDFGVFLGMVSYLLLSRDVERVYHTGTRTAFTRGITNLWLQGRSRPTVEQTEIKSLRDTFK